MSVYKPKRSPFWHYDFIWKGHRYHGTTGEKKKSDAQAIEDAVKTKVRRGEYFPQRTDMTLDVAAGLYYEEIAKHQSTGDDMLYQASNLTERLGKNILLSQITDAKVAEYISRRRADYRKQDKRNKRTVSPATVNRELEVLRRIMYRARDVRKVDIAEVDWKGHKLKEAPLRTRVLSQDEEARLIEQAAEHLKDPIRFSLLTGLRLSNVLKLDWSQIDLQARTMSFVVKGGKRHTLPVTGALLVLLAQHQPRDKGPVFRRNGNKITSWRTAWRAALRRAGISDFRWHDLRHTVGSRVARSHGIAVAQKVLGHSDIATTQRYVHFEESVTLDAMEALSGENPRTSPGRLVDEKKKA